MKKAATKKKAAPKAEPMVPLCFNCDEPMEKAALFCSELCQQQASFVRYVRNVRQQGRDKQPDIAYVIKVRIAHILNGGYPEKEREIPPAVRQQVIARAKGMCEAKGCRRSGTDIDHIRGNSCDLTNLQYLCKECHGEKTQAGLKPITSDHPRYEEYMETIIPLMRRYTAKKPLRECDNHETWNAAQHAYMREVKAFFAAKQPALY